MMIHNEELDPTKGYLSQLRQMHPIKLGTIIDDKIVVETCYTMQGNYNVACFRLEGEADLRLASNHTHLLLIGGQFYEIGTLPVPNWQKRLPPA
jgi:hypothetical protein